MPKDLVASKHSNFYQGLLDRGLHYCLHHFRETWLYKQEEEVRKNAACLCLPHSLRAFTIFFMAVIIELECFPLSFTSIQV
jgi:hypothetical protein